MENFPSLKEKFLLLFFSSQLWENLKIARIRRPLSVWFMWRSIKVLRPRERKLFHFWEFFACLYRIFLFFTFFTQSQVSSFSSHIEFLSIFHQTFHAPSSQCSLCISNLLCLVQPRKFFHSITSTQTKRKQSRKEGWKMQTIYENEILKIDLSSTQFCKFSEKLSFIFAPSLPLLTFFRKKWRYWNMKYLMWRRK